LIVINFFSVSFFFLSNIEVKFLSSNSLALVIKVKFTSIVTVSYVKSVIASMESESNISRRILSIQASSKPLTTAHYSAITKEYIPVLIGNPLINEPRLSLIKPPAPTHLRLPLLHPSTFIFIQSIEGYFQLKRLIYFCLLTAPALLSIAC